MNEEEAIEILKETKKDNESKIMIINTNTSNIQIRWSNKDLKEMAEISNRCAKENKAIETVLNLLEKKDKEIEQYQNMLATNDMLHVLECEKKDKIIDLMTNYICSKCFDDITNRLKDDDIAYWGIEGSIKQYFKEKVENGRENSTCKFNLQSR